MIFLCNQCGTRISPSERDVGENEVGAAGQVGVGWKYWWHCFGCGCSGSFVVGTRQVCYLGCPVQKTTVHYQPQLVGPLPEGVCITVDPATGQGKCTLRGNVYRGDPKHMENLVAEQGFDPYIMEPTDEDIAHQARVTDQFVMRNLAWHVW